MTAAPETRNGVLLIGAIADQAAGTDARARAAVEALGRLLDGSRPTALEQWEVPPDDVARACAAVHGLAARAPSPLETRLQAIDASLAAAPTCGVPRDAALWSRDSSPEVRRAAVLLGAAGTERAAILRQAIADADQRVSAAAVAAGCRVEARTAGRRAPRSASGRRGAVAGRRADHRCGGRRRDAGLSGLGGDARRPRAAGDDAPRAAVAAARPCRRADSSAARQGDGLTVPDAPAALPLAPPAPSTDRGDRLARGARRVSALTMLSRLLGLAREQIFALTLGAAPPATRSWLPSASPTCCGISSRKGRCRPPSCPPTSRRCGMNRARRRTRSPTA